MSTATQGRAMARFSDRYFHGYVVAYDREEIVSRLCHRRRQRYLLLLGAAVKENVVLLIFAVTLACAAYSIIHCLKPGVRGSLRAATDCLSKVFGVLNWQAVERLDLIPVVVRAISYRELELMRQPASVTSRNTIRIPLEIFDCPARDIYESFVSVWRYNRGRPERSAPCAHKDAPNLPFSFPYLTSLNGSSGGLNTRQ